MDHIRRLARWICIFCFQCKSATYFDWMTLPCDHLICLDCFRRKKEFLKTMHECGCGAQFSVSAYDWLINHCQVANDEELGTS